jgi:hypothetical protein
MIVKETEEIKKEEYTHVLMNSIVDINAIDSFVADIAIASGWHPAGYGCMRAKVYEEDGRYYAEWYRSSTCD